MPYDRHAFYMTQEGYRMIWCVKASSLKYLKYVPFYLFHGEYHADWTASFGYEQQTGSAASLEP